MSQPSGLPLGSLQTSSFKCPSLGSRAGLWIEQLCTHRDAHLWIQRPAGTKLLIKRVLLILPQFLIEPSARWTWQHIALIGWAQIELYVSDAKPPLYARLVTPAKGWPIFPVVKEATQRHRLHPLLSNWPHQIKSSLTTNPKLKRPAPLWVICLYIERAAMDCFHWGWELLVGSFCAPCHYWQYTKDQVVSKHSSFGYRLASDYILIVWNKTCWYPWNLLR